MFFISSILTSMLHKFEILIIIYRHYIIQIQYRRQNFSIISSIIFRKFQDFFAIFFSLLLLIDQMKVSSLEVGISKM